jgi:voltage-gated potassium channel Kch
LIGATVVAYRRLKPAFGLLVAAIALVLYTVVWAEVYIAAEQANHSCLVANVTVVPASGFTVTDTYYLTLATLTTTGYGDISPQTEHCRRLVTAQLSEDFILVGSLVVIVGDAVVTLVRRRGGEAA